MQPLPARMKRPMRLVLRAFGPALLLAALAAGQQLDVTLEIIPGGGTAPGIPLAFETAGPSLWKAQEPGGQTVALAAAEGGGYWASVDGSPTQLIEAGDSVPLAVKRGTRTLPYTLTYRRRANGGEDFLWSAASHAEGRAVIGSCPVAVVLLDANADGVFDRQDTHLVNGQSVSPKHSFGLCGGEYQMEHVRSDGTAVTMARLDFTPLLRDGRLDFPLLHDRAGRVTRRDPGKVLLLDVWASWCRTCLDSFDRLKNLAAASAGRVQWIGMNVDDEDRLAIAESAMAACDLPWTVIARGLGESDPLWRTLDHAAGRGLTLPLYVIADDRGFLRYAGDGGPGLADLRRHLEELTRP